MSIEDIHNAIRVSGMPQEVIDEIWTDGVIDGQGLNKSLERYKRMVEQKKGN